MAYSQLVMEHFKNPHNAGQIPDADAIGEVGNPLCLTPENIVYFNNQVDLITNSYHHKKILSGNGRYNRIKKRYKRRYKGRIVVIKNKLGNIAVTPDHLILAIKKPRESYYRLTKNRKELTKTANWWHVQDLEKGDILLYPILKEVKDIKKITVKSKKLFYDFKSQDIPLEIRVDKNFLRLVGYFLAEGHTREKRCKTYLAFTFNLREKEYIDDVTNLIKKIFKLRPIIKYNKPHSIANIFIYNVHLARWFRKTFGDKGVNKHLPDWMILLPAIKQQSLILGLWRGDGYIDLVRGRATYVTISQQLAHQIKILLLRQRISFSFYQEKAKKIKGVRHQKAFRIHIGQQEALNKLGKILGKKIVKNRPLAVDSWFDNNFLYLPITKVFLKKYKGLVYNFGISKIHSYVTTSAIVHNCGDMMKIYIKVRKDDKDDRLKDIITDIKFETLGCAAAIACSSILTDMARDKNLADAFNISRQDIVRGLGDLPPVKIHCSVLASDGLKMAIQKYLEKEGVLDQYPEIKSFEVKECH